MGIFCRFSLCLVGSFVICVWGSMDFVLDDFVINPTWDKINSCKKADLLTVANCYNVKVSYQARKAELRKELCDKLVEKGVLPLAEEGKNKEEEAGTVEEASGGTVSSGEPEVVFPAAAGMSAENLRLILQIKELEMKQKELELQAMHVRVRTLELEKSAPATSAPLSPPPSSNTFDISKHIALVPLFRESEVDSYFHVFERIAAALSWPKEFWSLLLHCKLVGKTQEVCTSLTVEQSLDYDVVKSTVLRAYELVPEAYRQKFRSSKKTANQTYVEFAREKSLQFDKWCQASKADTFETLRELILLEEFKKCLPEQIVVYLNEQKVTSMDKAAVHSDEYNLTHKGSFVTSGSRNGNYESDKKNKSPKMARKGPFVASGESRECFYCREAGHLIAVCPVLRRKMQHKSSKNPAGVGLIKAAPLLETRTVSDSETEVDARYLPFISKGFVSLTGEDRDKVPVTILRDTGADHSFMLDNLLPLSDQSSCKSDLLVWGIKMSVVKAPLHNVHLQSSFLSGQVRVAVRPRLPVKGVSFILGNDLAGGQVYPAPEVVDEPICSSSDSAPCPSLSLFPACVITRAQSRKMGEMVDLSDTFMVSKDLNKVSDVTVKEKCENVTLMPVETDVDFKIDREMLIKAQQSDSTLVQCWSSAVSDDKQFGSVCFFVENGVLMRKWAPDSTEWNTVTQVVVPVEYRPQVLRLAHDSVAGGHLGVKKTYLKILRNFFWPGLKSEVVKHCRSCHVCQLVGKPNQPIPPAPLQPIPVVAEPFERVLLDCVGPLPKAKSGHQYLLTIMCAATRYPEAIPLRTLKTKTIVKALLKFFSTFGLPRIVQTDQGTNFMSKIFSQVLTELNIKHITSSPYHPESQGALERFHQTLKSMIRKFCFESGREWDEGLPFLLLAVRESPQESLRFSPADLVFGHTVRGPLRLLRDAWLSSEPRAASNVLDYVSRFRERLHYVQNLASTNLAQAQTKMKQNFDKRTVKRSFQPGDKTLVLLPIPGSSLQAQFSGPYEIESKISETDYVVRTPDRRRKSRVCHINMLKRYFSREDAVPPPPQSSSVMTVTGANSYQLSDDGLRTNSSLPGVRLQNSEILTELNSFLSYLSKPARGDIIDLINKNVVLFSDHPKQTSVLSHDIDVEGHCPIKQHAYRVNPNKRKLMQTETNYLLEHGLAIPSNSPWSSPCVLVPKPDTTTRFCNDYRKVNSITKPDSYPLPRMEDCIDRVGAAKFVTKLDLLKGYWQVPLTPRASEISAFVTIYGDAFWT